MRRRLAEKELKPWQKKMWCIPRVDAEYVARMEDVLDLYAAPPDPRRPVVCFDETPRQLIGEARVPIKAKPGKPARVDYEYVRNGTANVFMFVDTHRGWRHAKVEAADKRTLSAEVAAWERRRNDQRARITWLFNVNGARKKLGRLYPSPLTRPATPAAAA